MCVDKALIIRTKVYLCKSARCYVHQVRLQGGPKRVSTNRKRTQNSPLIPVVQKVDNATHRINLYPVDCAAGFGNTYPLDQWIELISA